MTRVTTAPGYSGIRRRAQRARNQAYSCVSPRLPNAQGIASIRTPQSGQFTRRGA